MGMQALLLCTACLLVLPAPRAGAATRTWSGPDGGAWTSSANWGGTVPGTSDTAIIQSGAANGPNVTTPTTPVSQVRVGDTGTGALTISGGGSLGSTNGYVGYNAGSDGTATITGAGSSWGGNLTIGRAGTGGLSIIAGGEAISTNASIGDTASGIGSATVAGAGSDWTISNVIYVGNAGTGALRVEAGGMVASTSARVGQNLGSDGAVTVTGAGSSWGITNSLAIGNAGTGSVTVLDGGSVSFTGSGGFSIGHQPGSSGTLLVSGTDSRFASNSTIAIGNSGTGNLTLAADAVVSTGGNILIASSSGSSGTLNIGADAGSAATAPGTLATQHVVFGAGDGEIVFNHTSAAYVFTPEIDGNGTLTFLSGNTLLTGDLSGFTGSTSIAPGAHMTTVAAQGASLSSLSDDVNAAMIESRAIGQQLLGANRPMTGQNYGYAEAMYGSAQGLVGGQYAMGNFALIGGAAYGTQSHDGIEQDGATTFALAGRYMFGDGAVRPFVEFGGWLTPNGELTLSRVYAINELPDGLAGETATGTGVAEARSWAVYGRCGAAVTFAGRHELVGYGEIGRQSLSYDGYAESTGPFPATVQEGDMSFHVVRLGGSYTHDLGDLLPVRTAIILSGAAARSFGSEGAMDAKVAGVGFSSETVEDTSWSEFGARLHFRATDDIALSVGVTGTTAWDTDDTALHGFVGVSYRF